MEYQLTVTFSDIGRNPEFADPLLTHLLSTAPELAPVISSNTETGELTIIFGFTADEHPIEQIHQFSRELSERLQASGFENTPVLLGAHLSVVPDDELAADDTRELQPA